MLDTPTTIVPFVLFCKQIHVSACENFCTRDSSLSILISDKWFIRCWWLWNVNTGIAFNCSCTDLKTRLWRYFSFVIPHSFLCNGDFLVLTFKVRYQACLNPMSPDMASFTQNFSSRFSCSTLEFCFSRSIFVFPLRLVWIYDIRNPRYDAHCFLTTHKDDNLHCEVSLSLWYRWTTILTCFMPCSFPLCHE